MQMDWTTPNARKDYAIINPEIKSSHPHHLFDKLETSHFGIL